jgi:hypothetical protein
MTPPAVHVQAAAAWFRTHDVDAAEIPSLVIR